MKKLVMLFAAAIVLAALCFPPQAKPAAGYNELFGGDVLSEWEFDRWSIYTFRGIRLRGTTL